jgi:hypothetical protein
LQPPEATGKFWLERFSPYFTRPQDYGVKITGPGLAYQYVYDARSIDLAKIAYDFEYELENWRVDPHLYQELVDLVGEWQRRHASTDRPFLYFSKAMTYVTVYDGRDPSAPRRVRYDWPASAMIDVCNEAPKARDVIVQTLRTQHPDKELSDSAVEAALAELTEKHVLYEERGRYFTLAVPEHQFY